MLFLLLISAVCSYQLTHALYSNSSSTVCDTEGCKAISLFLASNVNFSAQPCDDFFAFACGGYYKEKEFSSIFTQLEAIASKQILSLMESSTLYGRETPIRSAKRFYERCLDMDSTETDLRTEVSDFVKNYADWPLFHANSSNFKVWKIAAKLQGELSISPFFNFFITNNVDDCDQQSSEPAIFSFWNLFDHKEYATQTKSNRSDNSFCITGLRREFQSVFENDESIVDESLNQICEFEQEMLEYFASHGVAESAQHLHLDELDTVMHSEPIWKSYFSRIAENDTSGKLKEWLKDKTVMLAQPSFLDFLVEKVETMPISAVGNFLLFKLIKFVKSFLMAPTNIGKTDYGAYAAEFSCPDRNSSFGRQKCDCLSKTLQMFPRIAGYLFIKPNNQTELENEFAKNFTAMIKDSAKKMFENNTWLSDMSKVRVLKKLENMISIIGFPKSVLNITELTDLYKYQTVKNDDNYFSVYRRFNMFSAADLDAKFDRYKLAMTELNINAVYDPSRNAFFFPFAYLEGSLFRSEYPEWFNLASAGTTVGHELFHAFDNRGSLYDHEGTKMSEDMQNPYLMVNSLEHYLNLTKCFTDDFSSHKYRFAENEYQVDGARSLGENLADFNGVQATFKAFQSAKDSRPSIGLKDFPNYTEDQMFFVAYASTFCSNEPNFEQMISGSARAVHAPDDARVNLVLRNTPEFREAFSCQPNDFMYQNYLGGQCRFY